MCCGTRITFGGFPSLKLTVRPWNQWLENGSSFWEGLVPGARVHFENTLDPQCARHTSGISPKFAKFSQSHDRLVRPSQLVGACWNWLSTKSILNIFEYIWCLINSVLRDHQYDPIRAHKFPWFKNMMLCQVALFAKSWQVYPATFFNPSVATAAMKTSCRTPKRQHASVRGWETVGFWMIPRRYQRLQHIHVGMLL